MKYVNTFLHAALVGLIASLVSLTSGWLEIKTWVIFFGWANYFLHACDIKKSLKMLLAFFIGIFVAGFGSHTISYLNTVVSSGSELTITACVVFCIATVLIFLEIIEGWEAFIPATFLGTVLFFASGISLSNTLSELLPPLLIGIAAGYITIVSRNKLDQLLTKKTN